MAVAGVMPEYDEMTGVLHLAAFKDRMSAYIPATSEGRSLALVCTDIDNFEKINNVYGLQKADVLLTEMAQMLKEAGQDILQCCHSVADHFIFSIQYEDMDSLKRRLDGICKDFDQKIATRYKEETPRFGMGVHLVTDQDESVDKMVEYANVARKSLRIQKDKRVVIYDAKVNERMKRVSWIEANMHRALEDREFKAFLQPQYNLETGKVVGAEALVRWIRPDGSMIYPDNFIPLFEENGFILQLDFFVLAEVCNMISRRIREKKPCVPISVNQSRILFQDDDYVGKVAGTLAYYDTPPRYIEMELTERIFRDDLTDLAEKMTELKNLGVRWSIDDFGTGYSSLNLLKDLPVDIIKIDKSFLDGTDASETCKIIIRKTVELTQELDKIVVCEGVETENQAEYLRGIRCDMMQGNLYAKPMPMDEFEALLDKEMSA